MCCHPSSPAGILSLKGRQLLMHELNSVTDISGEGERLYSADKKAVVHIHSGGFSSVQSLSRVRLFATP